MLLGYSGTGSSFESFTPASVTFATTVLNANSKATKVTFKYSGTGSLTLTSLTPSASYSVNTTGIPSGACNLTGNTVLSAAGSCAFNVVFSAYGDQHDRRYGYGAELHRRSQQQHAGVAVDRRRHGSDVQSGEPELRQRGSWHDEVSRNRTVKNVSSSNTLHVPGTLFTVPTPRSTV